MMTTNVWYKLKLYDNGQFSTTCPMLIQSLRSYGPSGSWSFWSPDVEVSTAAILFWQPEAERTGHLPKNMDFDIWVRFSASYIVSLRLKANMVSWSSYYMHWKWIKQRSRGTMVPTFSAGRCPLDLMKMVFNELFTNSAHLEAIL